MPDPVACRTCGEPARAAGLCWAHYQAKRRAEGKTPKPRPHVIPVAAADVQERCLRRVAHEPHVARWDDSRESWCDGKPGDRLADLTAERDRLRARLDAVLALADQWIVMDERDVDGSWYGEEIRKAVTHAKVQR